VSNFDNNWRRKQELLMRPCADNIYKGIFGDKITIKRFDNVDEHVLDIKFAIDVMIKLTNGQILLGQEKFLSHQYAIYKTVTVEYKQNPKTDEDGDWFKLASQIYFVGYSNKLKNGFDLWAMLNWAELVICNNKGLVNWDIKNNKFDGARASFATAKLYDLPDSCIIDCSWKKSLDKQYVLL
jgi:hypothetical protein